MLLNFEKKGHDIKIEISDEPKITLKDSLKTKSIYKYKIVSFKVDDKEIYESKKYYEYSFEYTSDKIFVLHLKYNLAKKVSKALVNESLEPINLGLSKEIEDLFNGELKEKAENIIKIKEDELDKTIKKLDVAVTDDTICTLSCNTTYGYNLHIEGTHNESYLNKEITSYFDRYKKIPSNYKDKDLFECYVTEVDWGDYSITTYYKMLYKDLLKCLDRAKTLLSEYNNVCSIKEKEEQKRLNNLIAKAKETGVNQEVRRWHEDCNNPKEECDVDIVILYVDGSGNYSTKRHHTL